MRKTLRPTRVVNSPTHVGREDLDDAGLLAGPVVLQVEGHPLLVHLVRLHVLPRKLNHLRLPHTRRRLGLFQQFKEARISHPAVVAKKKIKMNTSNAKKHISSIFRFFLFFFLQYLHSQYITTKPMC